MQIRDLLTLLPIYRSQMGRVISINVAVLALLVILPEFARAETRMALVVGMGNYIGAPLPNAVSDAESVGAALETVGFDVSYSLNQDREGILQDLKAFDRKLGAQRPDWLVVYYAGHGIQFDGINYLVPINAEQNLDRPRDLANYAIELNQIIRGYLNHQTKRTFILLDACRDPGIFNNYEKKGLAGTAIEVDNLDLSFFFATQNDKYAYDGANGKSPFAQAIVENIAVPDQRWEKFIHAVRTRTKELTKEFEYGEQVPSLITSGSVNERPFYFVEEKKIEQTEACTTAWNYVVESGYRKSFCENYQRQYAHCTKYRKQANECLNPIEHGVIAEALYQDCRRLFKGSGGYRKDIRASYQKCEEAVRLTRHKDAAYHLAARHLKLEPCGEKATNFLRIAADQNHKSAARKLRRCEESN